MMKLTEVDLYYNTPFDFQNTIHFHSDSERDTFFNDKYNKKSFFPSQCFNFVKDRLTLDLTLDTADTYGLNYLRFRNEFDDYRWLYAYVNNTEYINNGVTRLYLVLDVVMSFTQGDFTNQIGQVYVKRQSLDEAQYKYNEKFLATNDDVLNLPKMYTHQMLEHWKNLNVIFTSSVDLRSEFGTEDDPKLTTSSGQTHDGITSPVDLYICTTQQDFTDMMNSLKNYPWISQNINNIVLVPADVVDQSDISEITNAKNDFINQHVKRFRNNTETQTVPMDALDVKRSEFNSKFGFSSNTPRFLMREAYAQMELTNWSGQTIYVDPVFLPESGLEMKAQAVFGYENEIRCFPNLYKDNGENSILGLWRGTYANNAIIFKAFDTIPVLVDNYKLQKSQTAHQRELNNSRQITGRVNSVMDNNESLQNRFMNALSLTTSLAGGVAGNASSSLLNEWEYYRDQQAKFEDMAISAPSVSEQNRTNSFNICREIYGVTLRFQAISDIDADKVIRYHANFGFDFRGTLTTLYPISSSKILHYLSFSGNWNLKNVPAQFMEQLKIQLENGVKFWINNGSEYPFKQDVIDEFF